MTATPIWSIFCDYADPETSEACLQWAGEELTVEAARLAARNAGWETNPQHAGGDRCPKHRTRSTRRTP